MEGWGFGSVDESGAIDRVVAFEGLVPGAQTNPSSVAADRKLE
jgi:hypothetical protein